MPTISVDREDLFTSLGREYTQPELDELCFEYGIELDEWLEAGENGEERATLKIEIPANRYDMLCYEGIATALNVYLNRRKAPQYKVSPPKLTLTVEPEVAQIRPYAAAAVLRGVKFTDRRYKSFIALQDKLHSNICRNRSLVAIGTHDLGKVKGDLRYRALPQESFHFAPLNQSKIMSGKEVLEFYSQPGNSLAKFVPLIADSPVLPVFMDSTDQVLSMPPLINSDATKIELSTTDIFFDLTATDKTKLDIVLNEVVAMFAEYADEIEAVNVVSAQNGGKDGSNDVVVLPKLDVPYTMQVDKKYLDAVLGLNLSSNEYLKLLEKMMLSGQADGDLLNLVIPKTRPDILHPCDIVEDAGIAYGFNNLSRRFPASAGLIGTPLPINKVGDIFRTEAAYAGWAEVMPLTLCSVNENYNFLNLEEDNKAVRLANPKTMEYQVVRTSLLPGLLKTVRENRNHSLPIKVFECGDVVFQDLNAERRAVNQRNFAALFAGVSASFEVPHGLLDRLMKMLRYTPGKHDRGYWLEESSLKTFFPQRGAVIKLQQGDDVKEIGRLGVLHPSVLKNFDLPFVCSTFEIDLSVF